MADREKVVEHLYDCVAASKPENMWVFVRKDIVGDAIDLLKEQEHSETFIVIDNETGEEANPYNIALYEDWAKHLCYCGMKGWAIEDNGTLLLVDECGQIAYADRERFKVKWE